MPSMKLYPYSGVLVNHHYLGKVHGMPSKSDRPNLYYISTNEIPGELCGENISSRVETKEVSSYRKKSPMLWLRNKQCLSQQENIGLAFQCFFLEEKYFTCPLRICARPCNILYIRASTNGHLSTSLLHSRFQSRHATSRLWGGALRDDTKNGCVADYLSATATFLADSVVSASLPKVAVVETFNCISLTGFGYNQPRRNFSTGVYKIITTDLLYLKCTENGK